MTLLLVLVLLGPTMPNDVYPPDPVCAHIEALQIEYLSDTVMDLCPDITPFFHGYKDKLHALFVVQCESGGDPLANTRRWGGGTDGIWAFMEYLHWSERLRGLPMDPFDTASASNMAAVLVYETSSGWYNWWSCHRGFNHLLTQYGIKQVWHCPPAAYWLNVPNGSNFVCGGNTYHN